MSFPNFLKLGLFARHVVLGVANTRLLGRFRFLISRDYRFQQMVLLFEVKFVDRLKFLLVLGLVLTEKMFDCILNGQGFTVSFKL